MLWRQSPSSLTAALARWREPWSAWRTSLVTLIAVAALWRLVILLQWSWYEDDWVYLHEASATPFWTYVARVHNGHLMPGQFALVWLLQRAAPLRHEWAVAVVWTMALAASLIWAVLLRTVFGHRWMVLLCLVPILFAPGTVLVTTWTAAALQIYGMQIASGLTLLATLAFVRTGRRRSWLLVVIAYAGAVLWWQKALLIAVPALGLTLFLTREHPARTRRRRTFALAAGLGLVAAPEILWYLSVAVGQDHAALTHRRSLPDVIEYCWTSVTAALLPALAGGPWRADATVPHRTPAPVGVLQWTLIAVALGAGLWLTSRRRGAWILLLATGVLLGSGWALVLASDRFDIGIGIAMDPRYSLDLLPTLVLFGGLLVVPAVGERRWRRDGAAPLRAPRWTAPTIMVIMAFSALFTMTTQWTAMRPVSPKPWVDRVLASAATLDGAAGVVDTNGDPTTISAAYFAEKGRLSYLLAPLRPPIRFDTPARTMYVTDPTGWLSPAAASDRVGVPRGPVPQCGYVVKPGEKAIVPVTTRLYNWTWGVTVGYLAQTDGVLEVHTDRVTTRLPVTRGPGEVSAVVTDSVSGVRLSTASGTGTVCVDRILVGPMTPVTDGASSPGR